MPIRTGTDIQRWHGCNLLVLISAQCRTARRRGGLSAMIAVARLSATPQRLATRAQ